ncbi:MAG: MFS transporter [bacterium]
MGDLADGAGGRGREAGLPLDEGGPPPPTPRRGIPLPKTFAALRHRNYRLFFAGQLVSLTGTWMQNIAQPWLVYALTGSPLYLGIVSFASSIPTLTLTLGAGVVVDRFPKRALLVVTQTWMMILALALAADVFTGLVQPWHIVVFSFLLGIGNAFDAPARQAFVVEMVEDRRDLQNAIALNSVVFQTARIIGPSLAGIALALVGAGWCFLLNGISFIAVIVGLRMMRLKPFIGAERGESPVAQLREGLHYVWHNKTVRVVISLVAASNLFAFGYAALMPAFARDVLGRGPRGLGALGACIGAGALAGALLVASATGFRRKGALLTFGNIFFPAMVLCFAASRVFPVSMLILVGVGFGFMVQNATANTIIQTSVPDGLRGRVMSVYMLVFHGFFPLGALMAGAVAQRVSIPVGAAFGASIALAWGLFLLWRAPFIRRLA